MAQIRAKAQPERPPYDEVTVVVPGVIKAWKRVQVNRKTGSWYTDPDVETYQSGVRREAKLVMAGDPPLSCALELSFLAVWPVPDGWSNKKRQLALDGFVPKITRPDLENTFKGVLDALQMIVFRDDKQIVSYGRCAKIYGDRPRLEIRFTIIDQMPLALPSTAAFKQADLFAGATA